MDEALKLWREWFKDDGNPIVAGECGGDLSCFFCGGWQVAVKSPCEHKPDCIYVRAKALIEST
jgi:hypothetical protein